MQKKLRKSINKNKLFLKGYFPFFLLGWSYYLALPILIIILNKYFIEYNINGFNEYVNISDASLFYFIVYSFLTLFVFILFNNKLKNKINLINNVKNFEKYIHLIIIIILNIVIFIYFKSSTGNLFNGYMDGLDINFIGGLSTILMILTFEYIYLNSKRFPFSNLLLLEILLISIILMGVGSRIYVLTAFTSIFFYATNYSNLKLSKFTFFIIIILVTFFITAIGVLRMGIGFQESSTDYLLYESLFTSISAITMFSNQLYDLFSFPDQFYINFISIVPSFIYPDKSSLMAPLVGTLGIESPYGAISIAATSIALFGYIGALLYFILWVIFLNKLRSLDYKNNGMAFYSCVVGLLPFIFFREHFFIQIKLIITFFILYILCEISRRIKL
jgi:hypothetical protein